MLRAQKDTTVQQLRQAMADAAGVLFVNFTGMTVAQANSLRRSLKDTNLQYQVVKNTLLARAIADTGYADAARHLHGTPTGVIWGPDDPVAVAKSVYAFARECEHVKVKGGIVEAEPIDAQQAFALSTSPSRGELQAGIALIAQGPGHRVMAAVASPAGNIVGAIEALQKRLDGGDSTAA